MSQLLQDLEELGFQMLFTERLGPCDHCGTTSETYWLPTEHRWICEDCVYTSQQTEKVQA